MADTTLTSVPASLYAGDSLAWLLTEENYPASDGWVMAFGFRSPAGTPINIVGTASGANHLITASATDSATWLPDSYKGVGVVTKGAEQHSIWKGAIQVLQNILTAPDNYDGRSHAAKCLAAINAVLEGKATRDVLNTTIAGQTIQRMTWGELTNAKAYYQSLVDGETAAENAENGLGNGRNVLIRFGNA